MSISDEFRFIEELSMTEDYDLPCSCALLPDNIPRNRYVNVLPFDDTRVLLSQEDGGSDYINANWIENHTYISTQGPTEETIGDFWRMIWEHRVYVIVMLTKEEENGTAKCNCYWPNDLEVTWGNITVKHLETTEDTKQLIQRKFSVKNIRLDEVRIVHMLQCVTWPDHGLPESPEVFVRLLETVDVINSPPTHGPIVVHCSAGIGRSGTFCCVHSLSHTLRENYPEKVPPEMKAEIEQLVSNTVLRLRKQRAGMVQTREQYYFCYVAVLAACDPKFRRSLLRKEAQREAKRLEEARLGQDGTEEG